MDKSTIFSFIKDKINILFLLLTILFVIIIFYLGSRDINAINSKIYIYAFTAIFPLIACFFYILQKRSSFNVHIIIGIIKTFFVIGCILYLYSLLNSFGLFLVGFIINILLFLLVLVGLAIIYQSFRDYFLKIGGYSRFLVLFLFYLPCLFIVFLNFITNELKITPKITYLLFLIELLLIVMYYYFSRLFQIDLSLEGGEKILNTKQFLDTKQILYIQNNDKETKETDSLRTKFSISLWVYVNTPEFNTFEFPIMCYGNNYNPKPKITYGYDDESKQYVFSIYISTLNKVIKLLLPSQRWNNFVFNYDGSMVDLFINGILERSVDIKNDMPIYYINDSFIIGSDEQGINGAITNITYYNRNLSSFEILGLYRLGISTIDL